MRRILGLIALVATTTSADDTIVEVMTVRHRPASDLVDVLEPLTGPDGSVAAMENRLIVRAAPASLQRIRDLLVSLDVAPRTLWVTVRQRSAGAISESSGSVTASVPIDGTTIDVRPDGTTVTTTKRSRTRVTGSFDAAAAIESGSDVQRLQCLEGRPAFIHVGRAVPVPQPLVPAAAYAEAVTGFWVLPRLAGAVVTLELAVSKYGFESRGTIGTRQTQTSVSGRLGDWLAVSGSSLVRDVSERGLADRTDARESQDWFVDLKVEAGSR